MLSKVIQVLSNETVQVASTTSQGVLSAPPVTFGAVGANIGGPLTSAPFATDNIALWVLLVRVAGTVTGTTPTLLFVVQQSNDQVTWTGVGAALANITAAGVQVTPYATGTTQGAITQAYVRVVATPGGTAGFFPGVYADLIGQQV